MGSVPRGDPAGRDRTGSDGRVDRVHQPPGPVLPGSCGVLHDGLHRTDLAASRVTLVETLFHHESGGHHDCQLAAVAFHAHSRRAARSWRPRPRRRARIRWRPGPGQPPLVSLVEVTDDGACAVGAFGDDLHANGVGQPAERRVRARTKVDDEFVCRDPGQHRLQQRAPACRQCGLSGNFDVAESRYAGTESSACRRPKSAEPTASRARARPAAAPVSDSMSSASYSTPV